MTKIIRIMGGLGNQMFQYAFGKVLGRNTKYDISWFEESKYDPTITPREYELDFWYLPSIKLVNILSKKMKFRKILGLFKVKRNWPYYEEKSESSYDRELLKIRKGIIEGYFQVAEYYQNIRPLLLKSFRPVKSPNAKNRQILDKMKSTNSVSIHIRRGDYVKLKKIHGLCDIDWYQKAIKIISKKVKNPYFFIFSDDMKWVKKNLKIDFPHDYIDFNQGKESAWDMWLMKHCQHNIIANSSFSWWGAYLNENPNKIVIAPKQWFADGRKVKILPQEWQKI